MLKNMIGWCVSGLMLSDAQTSSRRRTVWRGAGSNVPTTVSGAVDRCAALVARCVAFCLIGFFAAGQVGAQTISTVAGNGTYGFAGDGGAATSASLRNPNGMAVDSAGNIFVADRANHRIRKITVATGVITTVAGNATQGFGGDGGPATSANLNNPFGVAVDSSGNLYVADTLNQRIRKITVTTGVITTVAGTGTANGFGDGGLATSANLNYPVGVAVDSAGNIYVAVQESSRIRKITVATGIITAAVGTGFQGFAGGRTAAAVWRVAKHAIGLVNFIHVTVGTYGNWRCDKSRSE